MMSNFCVAYCNVSLLAMKGGSNKSVLIKIEVMKMHVNRLKQRGENGGEMKISLQIIK